MRGLCITLRSLGLFLVIFSFVGVTHSQPSGGQGQFSGDRIPDMTGEWDVYIILSCGFDDVWSNEDYAPCGSAETPFPLLFTAQTGRIFTGMKEGGGDKQIGILMPDGTVSIQSFEPGATPKRSFLTGTLRREGDSLVIRGYGHLYEVGIVLEQQMTVAHFVAYKHQEEE